MPDKAQPISLASKTLEAFAAYVHDAEDAMRESASPSVPFLWTDADPARASDVAQGKVLAQFSSGSKPKSVPEGLIHDWIGAAQIPGVTMARTLRLIQDYDNHKKIYKPDVIDSKLRSRHGDDFKIYLRLLKKKIITVVLDTEHDVHYGSLGEKRGTCWSHTTRVSEVLNSGKPDEKILTSDTGYGFLWRLNSYWRFEERDSGVCIECRAISLTRDIPKGLGWIIEPIIKKLPKESLINTLTATRRALTESGHGRMSE